MGCGASSKNVQSDYKEVDKKTTTPSQQVIGIIINGATELPSKDSDGGSDPFCVARFGKLGSLWEDISAFQRKTRVGDATNPQWTTAFPFYSEVDNVGDLELQLRVYDEDTWTRDDFIGEAKIALSAEQAKVAKKGGTSQLTVPLTPGPGTISISIGPVSILQQDGAVPPIIDTGSRPCGENKTVKVADVTGQGPFVLGKAPLPPQLRGLYWLSDQEWGSALVSFGQSRDGGLVSTGMLTSDGKYRIRNAGDRTWSYATEKPLSSGKRSDFTYEFDFNSAENPTSCRIYALISGLGLEGVSIMPSWLMGFEMHLMQDGHTEYPGSVVWRRDSYWLPTTENKELVSARYYVVQVINEAGDKLEPAWSKFVEYQNDPKNGSDPGVLHYAEIEEEP